MIRKLLLVSVLCLLMSRVDALAATTQYQYQTLKLPPSKGTIAFNASETGTIAGSIDGLDGVRRGFALMPDGQLEIFQGGGDSPFTELRSVNSTGQWAVYYSNQDFSIFDAFRREADGTMKSVNILGKPEASNFSVAVNEAGDVLVQGSGTTFVRTASNQETEVLIPGFATNAGWGMNNRKQIIGVAWPGSFDTDNGFIYDLERGTAEIWNYPGAAETSLYDINDDGVLVGEREIGAGAGSFAFVRHTDGTLQDIQYPGAVSTRVWGINNQGVLTGRYLDANRTSFAFVAYPVPEPSGLLFVSLAAIGLMSVRGRQRGRLS